MLLARNVDLQETIAGKDVESTCDQVNFEKSQCTVHSVRYQADLYLDEKDLA